jgi:hypothetical protein
MNDCMADNDETHRYAEHIRKHLPLQPELALRLLPHFSSPEQRKSSARLIARIWARQDINAAWNAVARSPLSSADKQVMFNELWG